MLPAPLSCCVVEDRHDDDSEEEEVPSYSFAKALQTAQQAFLLPDSTQPEVEWAEGAEQGAEETEVCGHHPPHCPATGSLERQPSPSRLYCILSSHEPVRPVPPAHATSTLAWSGSIHRWMESLQHTLPFRSD